MGTDIRNKFENFLILNRMAPKTQIAYLGAITGLAQYYNLSPDKLSNDQIQQYLVYLIRHRKLK
jgi:integrase/recombinase XerD